LNQESVNILQKEAGFSDLLAEIAYTFNAISSDFFDISMENVLSILGMHLELSRVFVFENDEILNQSECNYHWNTESLAPIGNFAELADITNFETWNSSIHEKGQLICNDVNSTFDGEVLEMLTRNQIKSLLVYPLYVNGNYLGFLGFADCFEFKNWQKREVSFLRTISHLIVDAFTRRLNELKLKDSEEKYRNLFENALDANFILAGLEIIEFNQATLQLFQTTHKELIKRNLLEVSAKEQLNNEASISLIKKHIASALKGEKQTFPWIFEQQNSKLLQTEVSLSRFNRGEEFYLLAVIRDITKTKEHEQQLQEHMQKLREVNNTKDRFFSIIAHDLRNPFNSLIGISENLYENFENLDPLEVKEYLGLLQQSSQQAFNLLENLLNWSRSQTGKLKVNAKLIIPYDLIENVLDLLKNNAIEKQIRIENLVPIDYLGVADENMITTILRNLISNAIKFTQSGGKIVIDAQKKEKQLIISVADNGQGMTDEIKSKLFQSNVFNSTLGTNNECGTGLGIILCKEFIERNKGEIWVESTLGKGSCFYFSFPRA